MSFKNFINKIPNKVIVYLVVIAFVILAIVFCYTVVFTNKTVDLKFITFGNVSEELIAHNERLREENNQLIEDNDEMKEKLLKSVPIGKVSTLREELKELKIIKKQKEELGINYNKLETKLENANNQIIELNEELENYKKEDKKQELKLSEAILNLRTYSSGEVLVLKGGPAKSVVSNNNHIATVEKSSDGNKIRIQAQKNYGEAKITVINNHGESAEIYVKVTFQQ